jgi:hypothetical protein
LHTDDDLVRALALVYSHGNPYFVADARALALGDVSASSDAEASPEEDARTSLAQIVKSGGQPLVGLLAVPTTWAGVYGRHPGALFEPCTNISIGTAMLSAFDAECAPRAPPRARPRVRPSAPSTARRACILERYAEAIGAPPSELAQAVEAQRAALRAEPEPPPQTVESAALFADGTDDGSGSDDGSPSAQIFFPAAPVVPSPRPSASAPASTIVPLPPLGPRSGAADSLSSALAPSASTPRGTSPLPSSGL